ncbi:MAG: alpha/beta fold hydrolase [Pseudomonadota bacterium]
MPDGQSEQARDASARIAADAPLTPAPPIDGDRSHRAIETRALAPEFTTEPGAAQFDDYGTKSLDLAFKAHLARFTLGVSPAGMLERFVAWSGHLAISPGKQLQLIEKAQSKAAQLWLHACGVALGLKPEPCIAPLPQDHRFDHPLWRTPPYSLIHQAFLFQQQWWHNATNDIHGLDPHAQRVLSFTARQMLDVFSPSNFVATNPELTQETLRRGGGNLLEGFQNLLVDWERQVAGKPPAEAATFKVGETLATTPGKVVYRNNLIELIQYTPQTESVSPEPVLIVPAWIMKYYILDLSPHNSLVRYLVEQGFTVFMISWKNPTADDRELSMEDYRRSGVMDALDVASEIAGGRKVHGVGYCIGGTLLAIAAAAMARDQDDRFQTLTMLAAQTDFSEPGELNLFISESEISFLETMMWDQGYLDTKQMHGAFQLLRSSDLIWSRYVHEYLMARRPKMFDLMAWNADATRMPYRMHSEYLRQIYLENRLSKGQFDVAGRPIAIRDVNAPIFAVGTTKDHVAPWRSVHKIHILADTEITFVLTNGGHNAGIVSEPGHPKRSYQIATTLENDPYRAPDEWRASAQAFEGSWWPAWVDWLRTRSGSAAAPPAMGEPLLDAPGAYVLRT